MLEPRDVSEEGFVDYHATTAEGGRPDLGVRLGETREGPTCPTRGYQECATRKRGMPDSRFTTVHSRTICTFLASHFRGALARTLCI